MSIMFSWFASIWSSEVEWSHFLYKKSVFMRRSDHIIVIFKVQPSSETRMERCPGPTPDKSSIDNVGLLVVVVGSVHEENTYSGVAILIDCFSLYDGTVCKQVVLDDAVSKNFFGFSSHHQQNIVQHQNRPNKWFEIIQIIILYNMWKTSWCRKVLSMLSASTLSLLKIISKQVSLWAMKIGSDYHIVFGISVNERLLLCGFFWEKRTALEYSGRFMPKRVVSW